MGPLRSGPRGITDGVSQYKTPGMRDSIRAQRGRARSALFYRVVVYLHIKLLGIAFYIEYIDNHVWNEIRALAQPNNNLLR